MYCVSLPDTKALDDSGGVSWTVVSERILMQLSSSSAEGRTRQNTSTGSLCELAATTRGLANAWVRSGVLRTQYKDLLCVHLIYFYFQAVVRIHEILDPQIHTFD